MTTITAHDETTIGLAPETDPRWRDDAACRGTDPALFFPEHGDTATVATAKSICRTCPAQAQCLEYALQLTGAGRVGGVWGGKTARERGRIRRARDAAGSTT